MKSLRFTVARRAIFVSVSFISSALLVTAAQAQPAVEQIAQANSAEVTLSAPPEAIVGSRIDIAWSATIEDRDMITIVPFGADEGTIGNSFRANTTSPAALQMPADPGLYEIRYVLGRGRTTVASIVIEVVDIEIALTAPDTTAAGSLFEVVRSTTVNDRDVIVIVPLAAGPSEGANPTRLNVEGPIALQAPSDLGIYEIRYVLDEGGRILGRTEIEVIEPEIRLDAPANAVAGAAIEVLWSAPTNDRDSIVIVPAGSPPGTRGNAIRAGVERPASLTTPGAAGEYEIRYVLGEDGRTIAARPITLSEPEVQLTALPRAIAGATIEATWSTAINQADVLTIVPLGTPEGLIGNSASPGNSGTTSLRVPDAPGVYEIRYVLGQGMRTLARVQVEVLRSVEPAAFLEAPSSVAPGERFDVTWAPTLASEDLRVVLARFDQPAFSWTQQVDVTTSTPAAMTAPEQIGVYELRLLDIQARDVVDRRLVEVTTGN